MIKIVRIKIVVRMIKDDKNSGNKNSCEDDKKVGIKIVRINIARIANAVQCHN